MFEGRKLIDRNYVRIAHDANTTSQINQLNSTPKIDSRTAKEEAVRRKAKSDCENLIGRRNMANLSRFELKHLVLIGAYSLALGASSALCNGRSNALPAMSFQRSARSAAHTSVQGYAAQQQQQHSPEPSHRELSERQSNYAPMVTRGFTGFDPITSSTSTNAGLMEPNSHSNVYHSIIDHTDRLNRRQASPAIQTSEARTDGDLSTAAGHHHGHAYGKYYEYRAVPKKKTWKYGYKRGNHKHTISRHEHGKAGKHPHFKTKVKWHDQKSKGKGVHLWDYNHHDKKHYHHHG